MPSSLEELCQLVTFGMSPLPNSTILFTVITMPSTSRIYNAQSLAGDTGFVIFRRQLPATKSRRLHSNHLELFDSAQNGSIFLNGVSNYQQREGNDCHIVVHLYQLLLMKG